MMRVFLSIAAFCLFFLGGAAQARDNFDYTSFGTIPVLHEGRVKPLDSFARIYLQRFSAAEYFEGGDAIVWLSEVLFDPPAAMERAIFYVPSKAMRARLGGEVDQRYVSFRALQSGLEDAQSELQDLLAVDAQSLTPDQTLLLDLHNRRMDFVHLTRSLSLFMPLDIDVPQAHRPDGDVMRYVDLARAQPRMQEDLRAIIMLKGEDIEAYSAQEAALARASFDLQMFQMSGASSALLRVIPFGEKRVSPWAVLTQGAGSADNLLYLDKWRVLVDAYRAGDREAFAAGAQALSQSAPSSFSVETLYHMIKPFHWALALYSLASVLLIMSGHSRFSFAPFAAFVASVLGTFMNGSGIAVRVFLLERPPVGTLYESIIFVALICAMFAVCVRALRPRSDLLLLSGALSAAVLLALAPMFVVRGESMEMLVAVLNTNFWLTTHVLMITAGYAFCLLVSVVAHVALAARGGLFKLHTEQLDSLERSVYQISIAALLLTAVGTALGGIWADQSWGRFWGWDPKENGALLIVLWLIWVQHGRLSGHLKPALFMALSAYLSVIVALACFGVNLLNVGLHSYGFIEGVALGLYSFIALESLLIGGLFIFAYRRERLV